MPDPESFLHDLYKRSKDQCSLYLTTFIPWAEITGELEEETWYEDHSATTPKGDTAQCNTTFTINRTLQLLRREHHYKLISPAGKEIASHSTTQNITWFYYKELIQLLSLSGWKTTNTIYDFDPESNGENAHLLTLFTEKQ